MPTNLFLTMFRAVGGNLCRGLKQVQLPHRPPGVPLIGQPLQQCQFLQSFIPGSVHLSHQLPGRFQHILTYFSMEEV